MSTEAEAPKKEGFFRRMTSWPRRLSVAARAAWLLAIGLTIMVIATWLLFYLDQQSFPWTQAMTWWRILGVIILVIVIPIVVYRGLLVWLEGERSRYPDIDYAWKAGVEALEGHGVALDSAPLFLVLGESSDAQRNAVMKSTGMGFRVANVPEGPAALHWYANPEAIFIFCSDVGWLTALAKLREKLARQGGGSTVVMRGGATAGGFPSDEVASREAPAARRAERAAPAPAAAASPAPSPAPRAPSGGQRGTMMLDHFVDQSQPAPAPAPAPRPVSAAPGESGAEEFGSMRVSDFAGFGELSEDVPVMVGERDSVEQLERMEYFCRFLQRHRAPLCGINGALTLLQFESLQAPPAEVEHLQRAIKGDLTSIQQTLQLRAPVIAAVVGLENERGFRELVRRVGRERAEIQRFGQKFDVRRFSTAGDLNALSAHVCGAFEDWVYALFREKEALTKPGNRYLYGLLCKVRCNLKARLGNLLADGFGYEPQRTADDDRFFFSGCYFAATGNSPDRQAFVRGVIEKLVGEQELLEWNRRATATQRNYRLLAATGYVVAGVLLFVSIAAVVYNRFGS